MAKAKFPVLFRQDGATDDFFIVFPVIGTVVSAQIVDYEGKHTNHIKEDKSFVLAGKLQTTYHCDVKGNFDYGSGHSTSYSVIPVLLNLEYMKTNMWALEPNKISGNDVDDMADDEALPQKVLIAGILKLLTVSKAMCNGTSWAKTYEEKYLNGLKIFQGSNFTASHSKFLLENSSNFSSTLKTYGLAKACADSYALNMAEDFI